MSLNGNEPFVSIITPVYNGEKFLRECIESVLVQEYKNWEYVLINNCSTDSSLQIMEEYAENDSRIRIHNNEEFLPQMQNLNHAFRQISPDSKYCKVVHDDDWMFPECIARMVELAEKYPTAGIVGSYYLDDTIVRPEGLRYPSHLIPGKKLGRDYFLNGHTIFGAPSNLLIRSDQVLSREEVYDPDDIHSDHGACLDILKKHDFGFVHQVLTFSRRHPDSHTNKVANVYGTYTVGKIKNLMAHGSYYIGAEAAGQLIASYMDQYYRKFVRRSVYRFSKDIYDYHIREIRKMGIDVNYLKIMKNLFFALINVKLVFSYVGKKLS